MLENAHPVWQRRDLAWSALETARINKIGRASPVNNVIGLLAG